MREIYVSEFDRVLSYLPGDKVAADHTEHSRARDTQQPADSVRLERSELPKALDSILFSIISRSHISLSGRHGDAIR